MTNSPTYDKQLELASKITGLGGDDPIPGSTLASDRFGRASYYLTRLPETEDTTQALASVLSVIRNAAQPFRIPDPGKPESAPTIWSTVADLTNKRYVFSSTTHPNIVWVDLDKLDFSEQSPVEKLDLQSKLALEGGIAGNVNDQFADSGDMTFLSLKLLEEFAKKSGS